MRAAPAVALAIALGAALAAPGPPASGDGASGRIVPFAVDVGGERAEGLLAIPARGTAEALVVLCHGWGLPAASWTPWLQDLADRGFLAVAMEYRGPADAWKVRNGTADTLAATLAVRAAHPAVQRTVVWGFSMGGQVSGLAVMAAPGLYDHWVSSAGVLNWAETYPINPFHIGAEAGGAPWQVPGTYRDLAPALNRTGFAGSGLQRAYLVAAAADLQVLVDQAQQGAANLAAQGVPVSVYTVTTGIRPDQPGPGPLPATHHPWGYGIVLAKAAGAPDPPEPLVQGVHDATLGVYVPQVGSASQPLRGNLAATAFSPPLRSPGR